MKPNKKRLVIAAFIIATGVTAWAGLSFNSSGSFPPSLRSWTWAAVSWRAHLFVRKAQGDIADLSWRELWFMAHHPGGFGLEGVATNAISAEGTIRNPFVSNEDHQNGAVIFRQRCSVCHGNNGTGGYAPPLNRPTLDHGDSDLAIYKTIRDGIPQTGMAPVGMSPRERWQVVGYLRTLQLSGLSKSTDQLPPIDVQVSWKDILSAANQTDQWLTYSGSLDGRRYTTLSEINSKNVSRLRIRWVHQFTSPELKSEATPIVSGGTVFMTEPTPGTVIALDARTGEQRWRFERNLAERLPACCGRVNRGLAVLGQKLFMGSLDGYLIALNARDGSIAWQIQVASPSEGYTMTGAPLIVNGLVVVGVAGDEYGVRGFLAAYDAETGTQKWRFYTVPGPGEVGHETWSDNAWKTGGGATWVTGSYDPDLDLLYWGTGNPAPGFQGDVRPGDNLFTASLVALHGSSGKLAWHFQFTPHDEHDRDATQTPILADIPMNGVVRKAIFVADRNGFYYVLDRTTGEFLVGVPFVRQNWAKGLDTKGRPIRSSEVESSSEGQLIRPGVGGASNWQNSAFDAKRGTIFVPATESASVFTKTHELRRGDLGLYTGSAGEDEGPRDYVVRALDVATGELKWERLAGQLQNGPRSVAYDRSGLLATAGGLVFGATAGVESAIDSATGEELWRVFLGGDTYAAPISFSLDGHQVILVSAGRALFEFGL